MKDQQDFNIKCEKYEQSIIGKIPKNLMWYNFFVIIITLGIVGGIIFFFPYKQTLSLKVYVLPDTSTVNTMVASNCKNIRFLEQIRDSICVNDKVILKDDLGKVYIGWVKEGLNIDRNQILVQFDISEDENSISLGKYNGKIIK